MSQLSPAVRCPSCGYPYPMSAVQLEVYRGRNMGCMNCGKPFRVEVPTPIDDLLPTAAPATQAPAPARRALASIRRLRVETRVVRRMSVGLGLLSCIFLIAAIVVGVGLETVDPEVSHTSISARAILLLLAAGAAMLALAGGVFSLMRPDGQWTSHNASSAVGLHASAAAAPVSEDVPPPSM